MWHASQSHQLRFVNLHHSAEKLSRRSIGADVKTSQRVSLCCIPQMQRAHKEMYPPAAAPSANGIIRPMFAPQERYDDEVYPPRVSIEYDDIGNGVPLLLIHGFPLDRTLWRTQIAGLSQLYRVIAPDLRGFGQSSETDGEAVDHGSICRRPLFAPGFRECQQACWGHLHGGYIALAFYARYADRSKV